MTYLQCVLCISFCPGSEGDGSSFLSMIMHSHGSRRVQKTLSGSMAKTPSAEEYSPEGFCYSSNLALHDILTLSLPYLTLPLGWTGSYTCPALSPMHVPECNHKVTGSGYKAVDSCEAVNRRL